MITLFFWKKNPKNILRVDHTNNISVSSLITSLHAFFSCFLKFSDSVNHLPLALTRTNFHFVPMKTLENLRALYIWIILCYWLIYCTASVYCSKAVHVDARVEACYVQNLKKRIFWVKFYRPKHRKKDWKKILFKKDSKAIYISVINGERAKV